MASTSRETFVLAFDRLRELPYGENPHQGAAYYAERGARTHLLAFVDQLQGKELSFNNLGDLSAARFLLSEFDRPACVIVKHATLRGRPRRHGRRGVREGARCGPGPRLRRRRRSESIGVPALAESLVEQFVEVLFALYEPGVDEIPGRKSSVRVLEHTEQRSVGESDLDYRRVLGGPRADA